MNEQNIYKKLFNLLKHHKLVDFENEISKLTDEFDLNIRDENNIYLLTYSIILNNQKITELLLQRKCQIDIIDKDNRSILYIPIIYGYINIIHLLLKHNKNAIGISIIDMKDNNGNIALHYAIHSKKLEIIQLLLAENSDANVFDYDNNNSLHLSIYSRSLDICRLVVKYISNINAFTKVGETALHIATNFQLYDICDILLQNKSDPNIQEIEHELSPLHYTASTNNIKIGELLLKYNADINLQDTFGNTPVHYALIENNIQIFELFLLSDKSINFNLWNVESMIPLHILLKNNDLIEKVEQLEKKIMEIIILKSNLSIQDAAGNTCLYLLVKNGLWKKYSYILKDKKLDIFIRNNKGEYIFNIIGDNYNQFIDLVTTSYINAFTRNPELEIKIIKKCPNIKNTKSCFNLIKNQILLYIKNIKTEKDTCPSSHGSCGVITQEGYKVNICTYTGTTLDILVGLIYILEKHKFACSTLSSDFTKNKDLCKFYRSIGVIVNSRCEFLNFEIVWVHYKLHIIENFEVLFKKCISKKKVFIIIPVGIELKQGSHANYIIYHVPSKSIERFEPHGSTFPSGFNYNPDLLDDLLELKFKNIDPEIKYFRPKDFIPKVGFQLMDVSEKHYKRIGDPGGFCALWSLWYVDMRLLYKEVDRKDLVSALIKSIKRQTLSFKNLIRNYSRNVVQLRDDLLAKVNMDINDWLNDLSTNTQIDKLLTELTLRVHKLM